MGRAAGAARPIGAYAAGALDPSARARGFATTSLLSEWGTIVGTELAQFTVPDRVVWPKRRDGAQVADAPKGHRVEGATLVLRVDGPRAIEVQHRSGQILERVNAYFGYRAIAEMRILQAPVARKTPRSACRRAADRSQRDARLRFRRGWRLTRGLAATRDQHPRQAHKPLSGFSRSCQNAGV